MNTLMTGFVVQGHTHIELNWIELNAFIVIVFLCIQRN